MPISHICPSCLTELAKVRAVPDPHYGLAVVVCPSCQTASVRTRHPDIEFWRGFRRFHQSLRMVIAKVFLMALLAGVMTLLISAAGDIYTPFGRFDLMYPFRDGDPWTTIFGMGVLVGSAIVMMVAVLLMSHQPRIYAIVILLGLTLVLFTSDYTINWIGIQIANIADFQQQHTLPKASEMIGRFQRYGFLSGVSLLGLVPAYLLRGIIERGPARRFRRLLGKRRKQRTIHD
ncbi:MAG: hypothetical protein JKY43_00760 [Phycisphaerales bacterium]|nr:hypothetical protein [Phycisphaerales bacterium]